MTILSDVKPSSYALRGEPGATLSEMVRNTLVALIVAGEFPNGHRLYPEELSEKLGVSITPVREALLQLANEGFIENIQRRGFHIRMPEASHIRDMWQVRQSLELMAGELLIDRLKSGEVNADELLVLEQLQRSQEGDPAKLDHATKLQLNADLHASIVKLCGNNLLRTYHESLRHRVLGALVQRGSDDWRSRVEAESMEHWAIINALKSRDLGAYHEAVREHLSRSLKDALKDVEVRRP